jgi:hypothetical protein
MDGRKTLNRHAALMNRMGQALGVNLTEMMIRGQLSGEDWREAVVRCSGCTAPDNCLHWLTERSDAGLHRSPAAPEYCTNREMIVRLRDRLADQDMMLAEAVEGGT